MNPIVINEATIVRRDGGGLEFVGPEADPRTEAVHRMNIAVMLGKMPSEADMAMCEGVPVIDEASIVIPAIIVIG